MELLRRKKKNDPSIEILSFTLAGADGDVWMKFPSEVVYATRQAITRMTRISPFPQCLSTISAIRREGTTYMSRAMGTVLAMDLSDTVCVLELNWWWPADYPPQLASHPGIAEVLLGNVTLEEAILPSALENLAFIPAGKMARGQMSSFSRSDELKTLILELSETYDHLILDLPSVTLTNDAIPLASLGTALCMVICQGVTPVPRVRSALDDLNHLNIVGVIMNQVNVATPSFILDYVTQE